MYWTNIEYLKEVIMKQCECAKVRFEDVDFDSRTWFQDVTWTKEQEAEFEVWVKDYLKTNTKARKQLMIFPSKTKKSLDKWFIGYNLMYGFRIKED